MQNKLLVVVALGILSIVFSSCSIKYVPVKSADIAITDDFAVLKDKDVTFAVENRYWIKDPQNLTDYFTTFYVSIKNNANHTIEIDQLAKTFNKMVDRLQRVIQEMREINDNIAHDLRSPLTRIRGAAEMTLMGEPSQADSEEMAVSIIEECDNLINMINTMLDIAETEAGVGELNVESVDMSTLILDACGLYNSIAREKHITLYTRVPEKVHYQGDKSKMQRLIANLLDNAIKYTPAQGTVTVALEDSDKKIVIRFADTGIGMPLSEIPRIFDRFYRGDASRSESGTGLGLSLAKAIAEAFGGSISVESTVHKGSTFTVILPR